jgi:gas vesicle protein
MIIRNFIDQVRHARSDREKAVRRNKAGMLALGLSIGCTVGAVAGVLFAPRSGKDTREDVSRRGSETWEKIKDNVSANSHRLVQAVEEKGDCLCTAGAKCDDSAKEPLKETSGKTEKPHPKTS